ncbi:alpha/beta fold hydrolase [Nitrosomonas sp. sh817]|uniref:alpha/beta fold hydrolase n=1 Tax=Nitrosomonas sp. sh817 TaxID=3070658 RepID=UPI0027DC4764|nr:alpha/beta hydrolase [Nitrosomonas sp. sh817]WMJ09801.1 alpha/beta hydrolase [Nitrosomonas sp. sh817]
MKLITSKDGTAIACWQSGSGDPLLLIHGTTGDHTTWTPPLSQLQRHFTVFTMDRRGRGHSGDNHSYALARECEDIAAVVDAIGDRVDVLGHSFGGLCALEAALLTPNIGKLILYEPSITLAGSNWSAALENRLQALWHQSAWEDSLLLFFRDLLKTPQHEMTALQAGSGWTSRVAAAHTILRELQSIDRYVFTPQRFQGLSHPVLLMIGGDSHERRFQTAGLLQQCLSHSQRVILPGQQHSAMRSAPALFAQTLIELLNQS